MKPLPNPSARAEAVRDLVRNKAEAPTDPFERAFFYLVENTPVDEDPVAEAVATAYELTQDPVAVPLLRALILFGAVGAQVDEALQLPPGTYEAFKHLFFARAAFPTVFAVLRFVREQAEDDREQYYNLASEEGPERLLDRFRIGPKPLPAPTQVLNELLADAHSRSFEHRGRSITSRVAQESQRWQRHAASLADSLLKNEAAKQQPGSIVALKLALVSKDETKTPEELELDPRAIIRE